MEASAASKQFPHCFETPVETLVSLNVQVEVRLTSLIGADTRGGGVGASPAARGHIWRSESGREPLATWTWRSIMNPIGVLSCLSLLLAAAAAQAPKPCGEYQRH